VIVTFKKSFEKDLGKLRDADLLHKIQAVIEEAEAAVSPIDIKNLKKLKADGNYYRIRVGNYRIGLVLDEAEISFVRVLHRKEMYRYFP
jgi:mRNA interferase RelE/StbE